MVPSHDRRRNSRRVGGSDGVAITRRPEWAASSWRIAEKQPPSRSRLGRSQCRVASHSGWPRRQAGGGVKVPAPSALPGRQGGDSVAPRRPATVTEPGGRRPRGRRGGSDAKLGVHWQSWAAVVA